MRNLVAILCLSFAIVFTGIPHDAEAGLVEDLRSGESKIRAVGWLSSWHRQTWTPQLKNEFKQLPDYKVIVMYPRNQPKGGYYWWGANSAVQAVIGVFNFCKTRRLKCGIYALGDQVVEGHSQEKLADAIEAYQLEVSGIGGTLYCKRDDGSVYQTSLGPNGCTKQITKAEYENLYDKIVHCKRNNGTVYSSRTCAGARKITKAEYDRLKNQKKDAASKPEPETASSSDDPLEAKLEKLQRLLEKGLITKEEAAAKRTKLLEDL